jgi:hypothetical protein
MNYITERHHTFENGYIALRDLEFEGLPSEIVVASEILPVQAEHHISLVCTKDLAPLIDIENIAAVEQRLVEAFLQFESQNTMADYELKDELYVVETEERKSVVVGCTVPRLAELFEQLNAIFDCELPKQYAHITLYARDNAGIPILSRSVLKSIAKPIELSELSVIQKANAE